MTTVLEREHLAMTQDSSPLCTRALADRPHRATQSRWWTAHDAPKDASGTPQIPRDLAAIYEAVCGMGSLPLKESCCHLQSASWCR